MAHMRAIRAALLAAVVLAIAGCTSTAAPYVATSGPYSAVVDAPQSTSGDAAIAGSVVVDGKGCWSLSTNGGSGFRSIIWPSGTTLVGNKLQVPGVGKSLGVGTAIAGGGGGGPARRSYPPCITKGEEVTYVSDISLTP
jgi:hypothetical protein